MRARRYTVKSIFLTLQGEGHNAAARPSALPVHGLRNLWNGRQADRGRAVCRFCNRIRGNRHPAAACTHPPPSAFDGAIVGCRRAPPNRSWSITGGQPTLQLDSRLVDALHDAGAAIAIETNGTRPVIAGVDWICVSPKAGAPLRQVSGDEIKIAWPQTALDLDDLERLDFRYRLLQPINGPEAAANARLTVATCRRRPASGSSACSYTRSLASISWECSLLPVRSSTSLPHAPEGHKCGRLSMDTPSASVPSSSVRIWRNRTAGFVTSRRSPESVAPPSR